MMMISGTSPFHKVLLLSLQKTETPIQVHINQCCQFSKTSVTRDIKQSDNNCCQFAKPFVRTSSNQTTMTIPCEFSSFGSPQFQTFPPQEPPQEPPGAQINHPPRHYLLLLLLHRRRSSFGYHC